MDTVSKETRSRMMSAVRAKNTKLELEIRRRLFAKGFRYRLHKKDLPSKPDMVFSKYSAIIFVHGCFWHHHGCYRSTIPETRHGWWKKKLEGNHDRDNEAVKKLRELGWRILIIWECSFRRPGINRPEMLDKIADRSARFLESNKRMLSIPRVPYKDNRPKSKKV